MNVRAAFRVFVSTCACLSMCLFNVFPITTVEADTPTTQLSFSPSSQTVLENSTFDVSLYINTNGLDVNAVDITILYPPDKLSIISPSTGSSLLQLWLAPPTYSNTNGTAKFVGVVPNGVNASNGLITTLTFKALAAGKATLSLQSDTKVLVNDGLGTPTTVELGRDLVTINPAPPSGVAVASSSHPFASSWSNNPNALLDWTKDADVTDFSFILDDKPTTVPDDTADTTETSASFPQLADGQWYFHIKARRQGVWGPPSHYQLRIDTSPPASFRPQVDFIENQNPNNDQLPKTLISFFSSDALSGIDHYEVAVRTSTDDVSQAAIFVQAASPYQLPILFHESADVTVRAFDRAGNSRDETIHVVVPAHFIRLLKANKFIIAAAVLGILLLLLFLHFLFGHHILSAVERIISLLRNEEKLRAAEKEALQAYKDKVRERTS